MGTHTIHKAAKGTACATGPITPKSRNGQPELLRRLRPKKKCGKRQLGVYSCLGGPWGNTTVSDSRISTMRFLVVVSFVLFKPYKATVIIMIIIIIIIKICHDEPFAYSDNIQVDLVRRIIKLYIHTHISGDTQALIQTKFSRNFFDD